MARQRGFTLVELMIVVAVVAILAAFAYPLYTEQVAKSRRSEAIQNLTDFTLRQERWRANNATYATCAQLYNTAAGCTLAEGLSDHYTLDYDAAAPTGTTYSATATPKGAQTGDRCGTYTFAMLNGRVEKSVSGDADCDL